MFSRNRLDRDDRRKFSQPVDRSSAYSFHGRATRLEYGLALVMAGGLVAFAPHQVRLVPVLLPAVCSIRRLHDFGRSGWWVLLPVGAGLAGFLVATAAPASGVAAATLWTILAAGIAFTAVVGLMPSDRGPNRFGERVQRGGGWPVGAPRPAERWRASRR